MRSSLQLSEAEGAYETGRVATNGRSDVGSSHPSTLTGYGGVRSTNFASRAYQHTSSKTEP